MSPIGRVLHEPIGLKLFQIQISHVRSPMGNPEFLNTHSSSILEAFRLRVEQGKRPDLAEHLSRCENPGDKLVLFSEMLVLELLDRSRLGEKIEESQLLTRFPKVKPATINKIMRRVSEQLEAQQTLTVEPRQPEDSAESPTIVTSSDRERGDRERGDLIGTVAESEEQTIVGPTSATPAEGPDSGRAFGDYDLLDEIARGGMGVVYLARHRKLNRRVALKMILSGQLAGEEQVERFYTEAKAAANLDHVGIVPIFEVGECAGQHFFAMALVDGDSLSEEVSDGPIDHERAAALTKQIAEAIGYAHAQGVIHRDLKPSNVLIDSDGQPKVTDFGLAKQTKEDSGLTETGQILGTPSYMPPEQAAGKIDEVDERSDVYSIGGILYCLCTGRPPFQAATPMDTLLQVFEQEPIPPSRLNQKTPSDLETICLRCLSKEKQRRFGSATELADELGRFLSGEPIHSRPAGRVERAWRWCRRKPLTAATILLSVFVSLLLGVGGPIVAWQQSLLRGEALKQQGIAEEERKTTVEALDAANESLYANRLALALRYWQSGIVDLAQEQLDECPDELRHVEWNLLNQLCNAELVSIQLEGNAVDFEMTSDGSRMYVAMEQDEIQVWDMIDCVMVELINLPGTDVVRIGDISISENDRWIVVKAAGATYLLDLSDNSISRQLQATHESVTAVAIHAGGDRIALFSESSDAVEESYRLDLLSIETGEIVQSVSAQEYGTVSCEFTPNGEFVVGTGIDNDHVYDVSTGDVVSRFDSPNQMSSQDCISLDPTGTWAAAAGYRGVVIVNDIQSGSMTNIFTESKNTISGIDVSPSGTHIVTGGLDRIVRVTDLRMRSTVQFRGHHDGIRRVRFTHDGGRVVSLGYGGEIKIWDLLNRGHERFLENRNSPYGTEGLYLTNNDQHIVTGVGQHEVAVRDANSLRLLTTLYGHTQYLVGLGVSRNGKYVTSSDYAGNINTWELTTNSQLSTIQTPSEQVAKFAIASDGQRLFICHPNEQIWEWNPQTGEMIKLLRQERTETHGISISPDDRMLACCGEYATEIWDIETNKRLNVLGDHDGPYFSVAWSSDQSLLAVVREDSAIEIWDVAKGELVVTLHGNREPTNDLIFSADNRRLITGGFDQVLRFWDTNSGSELLSLELSDSEAERLAMTRAMNRLYIGHASGDITVLNTSPAVLGNAKERYHDHLAKSLVDASFKQLALRNDVLASIAFDQSLDDRIKERAVRLAELEKDEAVLLMQTVTQRFAYGADTTPLDVRIVDSTMQTTDELAPIMLVFGYSQVMSGQVVDGLATLQNLEVEQLEPRQHAYSLVLQALAEVRLGRADRARALRKRVAALTELKDDPALARILEPLELELQGLETLPLELRNSISTQYLELVSPRTIERDLADVLTEDQEPFVYAWISSLAENPIALSERSQQLLIDEPDGWEEGVELSNRAFDVAPFIVDVRITQSMAQVRAGYPKRAADLLDSISGSDVRARVRSRRALMSAFVARANGNDEVADSQLQVWNEVFRATASEEMLKLAEKVAKPQD